MSIRLIAPLACVVSITVGACTGDRPSVDESLTFEGSDPSLAEVRWVDAPPLTAWHVVGEWGSLDGPVTFSIINAVSVRSDSLVAVADRHTCSVVFIDIHADSTWSVGSCGDGPDEFRDISKLAFGESALWVYDLERRRFSELHPETSRVVRSVPLADYFDPTAVASISGIAVMGEQELLVGLRRRVPRGGRRSSLVAQLDLTDRRVSLLPVYDPIASRETSFAWAPSAAICDGRDEAVRVANEWTTQLTSRGFDGRERFNVIVEGRDWWTPTMMREVPPSPIPPLPGPRLACTQSVSFLAYKRRLRIEGKSTIMHSRLVAVTPGGSVVFDDEVDGPLDGTAHALTVGDATADILVTYTSAFADYPIVRVYRVPPALLDR